MQQLSAVALLLISDCAAVTCVTATHSHSPEHSQGPQAPGGIVALPARAEYSSPTDKQCPDLGRCETSPGNSQNDPCELQSVNRINDGARPTSNQAGRAPSKLVVRRRT